MKGGLETNSENRFKTHLSTVRRFRINGLSRGWVNHHGALRAEEKKFVKHIYICD